MYIWKYPFRSHELTMYVPMQSASCEYIISVNHYEHIMITNKSHHLATSCRPHWYSAMTCLHLSYLTHLRPGRFVYIFRQVIFKLILLINDWGISCETVPKWMSLDLNDGKSTLVQVMAWCRQSTRHYLSRCWPRSVPPYGLIKHKCVWVNWVIIGLVIGWLQVPVPRLFSTKPLPEPTLI